HLSDANNKWNCMALTFNDISFPSDDLSFQKTELVSVSEKNNQWNKLARISQTTGCIGVENLG
ncbi:MAG: hypothetical protein QF497_15330, partial [Verrucomicrobiota bacterium]|nr:hypothetical protein [Verrucomicrobiota bacterium]